MSEINWLDAQSIITVGGFLLIALTVFAESGIFFLFFLPGDYLLFSAGLLCSPKLAVLPTPIQFYVKDHVHIFAKKGKLKNLATSFLKIQSIDDLVVFCKSKN
jgi:hypothetical protein